MVGLSGGVDSSVTAARLQGLGYEVIGVFIKVWHPDFLVCDWETERRDAMYVAAHLGIPFLTCDAEEVYYKDVAQYFIEAYRSGLTPNPDVMCNRAVKFGIFWEYAQSLGIDYIATGHYAQNIYNQKTESHELHRGIDENKDQSYFLWTLTNDDLDHILFPIGDSNKNEIRTEANKYGLPTARKADSQGICFLGHVDIPNFLSNFISLEPGLVLDEYGSSIGIHQGSVCYTIGQRHGFSVHAAPYAGIPLYILAIDHKLNQLIVGPRPPIYEPKTEINLVQVNVTAIVTDSVECEVQLRYRQKPLPALLKKTSSGQVTVTLQKSTEQAAPGQSCVLYQGNHCIGGGIIK